MKYWSRIIIVIAGLVIASLLGLWAFNSLEFTEVEKDFPPTDRAQRDPWLAIERSLSPKIERYEGAGLVPLASASSLVIYIWDLYRFDADAIVSWVKGGGRLIIIFEEEKDEMQTTLPEVPLFAGLEPRYSEEGVYTSAKTTETLKRESDIFKALPERISADPNVYFYEAEPDPSTALYGYQDECKAVVRAYGKGIVFACGAPYALYNEGLKNEENRRLASFLFGGEAKPDTKAFIPRNVISTDSVGRRFDATPILISSAVVFILLFWMGGPRLGNVIEDEVPGRRSLRERFQAEGHFLWQHRAARYMLGSEENKKGLNKRSFVNAVNAIVKSERTRSEKNHDNRKSE
jgi:hypothetical protein